MAGDMYTIIFTLFITAIITCTSSSANEEILWKRRTVANVSEGADGVRLADANHDGLMDIVTPWEEGGSISVSLHPGVEDVRQPWPTKIIAGVPAPEDAVWADLDGDGVYEIVTCAEGKERSVWVHWNTSGGPLGEWKSEPFPQLKNTQLWMYCTPAQVDGLNGTDLIIGSKGQNGSVSWLQSPPDPAILKDWKLRKITDAGWIMSLIPFGDEHGVLTDLFVTDRKNNTRAAKQFHLSPSHSFGEHVIGSENQEAMFMDAADLDQDGLLDFVVATYADEIDFHRQVSKHGWKIQTESWTIKQPPNSGTGKSVRVGDIDLDGDMDLALTCGNSKNKHGVMWLSYKESIKETEWQMHDIAGLEGTKFDRIELIDLDSDGDLDLLTCEEREGLGVIWYENPTR